ncbi:response regulator [Microvirga subterranea]|uniref:Response regulator receiver domain-containing protein n=1 Tax=Microvirga subterranea TaxID=186651 RepID=A0A370H536_9HYPH|nr:response regulator [Microvirga subterranea]RDI51506.1 hypothetical protein DES45_11737 [Microvirga subterranea]
MFEAVNADDALAVLETRPDVQAVVTDIEMPGALAGIEVVVTSRRQRPGPEDLLEQAAFLAKPYLPETVIQVIRKMATPQVVEAAPAVSGQAAGAT